MKQVLMNIDVWGFASSLLCAIHCAALPVLISFGLLQGNNWMNSLMFELSFIILSASLVYFSIVKGYLKGQVTKLSLTAGLLGLFFILTHHFFGALSNYFVVFGGLMVAFSHLNKLFLLKKP